MIKKNRNSNDLLRCRFKNLKYEILEQTSLGKRIEEK